MSESPVFLLLLYNVKEIPSFWSYKPLFEIFLIILFVFIPGNTPVRNVVRVYLYGIFLKVFICFSFGSRYLSKYFTYLCPLYLPLVLWIQYFRSKRIPNPDPWIVWPKLSTFTCRRKANTSCRSNIAIHKSLGLHKGRPRCRRSQFVFVFLLGHSTVLFFNPLLYSRLLYRIYEPGLCVLSANVNCRVVCLLKWKQSGSALKAGFYIEFLLNIFW